MPKAGCCADGNQPGKPLQRGNCANARCCSRLELLWNVARQFSVAEGEHKELIRIQHKRTRRVRGKLERVGNRRQEIVVVGDKQRVKELALKHDILAKSHPFDLGRDQMFRCLSIPAALSLATMSRNSTLATGEIPAAGNEGTSLISIAPSRSIK